MRSIKGTLLENWFEEVWNNSRKEAIGQLLAKDVIAHGLGPAGDTIGSAEFEKFYDDFRNLLTNVRIVVEDVISQDDMESALTKLTGTHIATGKDVEIYGICMAKIKDGQIIEAWNHYDFLKMYLQIGYQLTPP